MLRADSDRTSVFPHGVPPSIPTERDSTQGGAHVGPVTITQPEVLASTNVTSGFELSGAGKPFNTNVIVFSPTQISIIDAYRDASAYFVYDLNTRASAAPVVQTISGASVHSFSQPSKTDETWATLSTLELEASRSLAELRSIVSGIRLGVTPQRSQEFEELLSRALVARGRPKDIEEWARRLAQDVS